ncbi:MAG: nucleotidyltransferase domain-containing protein [Rubrivivax sp.]|nr:nucleotidyltransferase domain-containing protein [Rubrivivax sp.]
MRLRADQTRDIVRIVRMHFGDDADVRLFGSRLDDDARGGDVDLLVESSRRPTPMQRARATMALERALGLPVDIVTAVKGEAGTPFEQIARRDARPIAEQAP